MTEDEEFLRDLMETFREDADEHLRVLSAAVVDLEATGSGEGSHAPIETMFREVHSLKGAAGAVENGPVESVCQGVESLLAGLKRGETDLTSAVVDLLSETVDCLHICLVTNETVAKYRANALLEKLSARSVPGRTQMVRDLGQARLTPMATTDSGPSAAPGAEPPPTLEALQVQGTTQPRETIPALEALQMRGPVQDPVQAPDRPGASSPAAQTSVQVSERAIAGGGPVAEQAAPEVARAVTAEEPAQATGQTQAPDGIQPVAASTDTVRVSTGKLESLMLQAEEFISVKLATNARSHTLRGLDSRLDVWRREWYQARISNDTEKMEEFLEWNSTFMEGLVADVRMLAKSADDERRTIGPMVDELLDGMKRVLMLPVSSLLSSFPKMVRDLARARGKQVELSMSGADIEIDKRIIENLKDPLIHLLRNSVDHGIETPEAREGLGKPARGLIRIAVSQLENNKIQIRVSDDGSGIDVQRLRDIAVREGLRTQSQMDGTDDNDALQLAFASGVSTSRVVSHVSGRGLGLAIVEEKVEQLGGMVAVETEPGKGTAFRITVPATLATARGILAQVSDWPFIMPVVGVDRVVRVHRGEVRMVENRETIQLEGHTVPLMYMHEVLDLPFKPQRNQSDYLQVIVAGAGEDRVGFAVDRIVDEQEVLVKTLGPQLARVRNVAGGTILGSGKVVPIMSISDLLQSCRGTAGGGYRPEAATGSAGARKSVLVAEDSITSRMLLKNVLEAAGYYVKPTVDGVDALAALREEDFDLVISDIEMPRMDGFELTSRIRGDARLCRVPVMLVTALESAEHRERGIDVGANAYLTKSSFTHGTLLETARSLM